MHQTQSNIEPTQPWKPYREEKITRAKLIADYLRQFETSGLHAEARSAGWSASLIRYVQAVAEVQAQLIVRGGGVGFSSAVIFAHISKSDGRGYDQIVADFWKEQRRISYLGYIDVQIPIEAIDEWRRISCRTGAKSVTPATHHAKQWLEHSVSSKNDVSSTEHHQQVEKHNQVTDCNTKTTDLDCF